MNGHHPGGGNPSREQNPAYGLLQPINLYQDEHVNDQAVWEQAVATASSSYTRLPTGIRAELDGVIAEVLLLKQQLVELVTSAGSVDICRTCGGECCRHGKYHVSVLDILAYLKNGSEPVIPDFSTNPACPYSAVSGCTMGPGYRPMTCVVFNCQKVEDQLTSAEQECFQGYEQKLRDAIKQTGHITGLRLGRPLLLSCSRITLPTSPQQGYTMATINDIVLVHVDDKPGFYARIEDITPDVKPGWWQVRLLVLTFPLQVFTWILDEFQLEYAPFTMGGTPIRLEPVVSPLEEERQQQEQQDIAERKRARQEGGSSKVVSLADRRKK